MTKPKLFEPISLRSLSVRNRIWLAPMCQYSAEDRSGRPTNWHLAHLGARAQGGFGLILTEAAAVLPEGRISPQDVGIWNDDQAGAWAPIVQFVQSQGARIGIQLAHAGRKASVYRPFAGEPKGSVPHEAGGWPTVGPSAVAFEGLAAPREMSAGDIEDVVTAFAAAAARALAAGFDTVELHAAHGYLLHEFLSPFSNKRTDEYGGDLAGRAKLLLDAAAAVRREWPDDLPILVRISASEWIDGGFDVNEATQVAAWLGDVGVDLIDVSSSGNVIADIPLGPGYQVPFASALRQSGLPTAAVGLIDSPTHAEQILLDGAADVILLARAAIREAGWPLRAAHELGLDWRESPYPPQYTRGHWGTVPAPMPGLGSGQNGQSADSQNGPDE